jgi:hypothetical protein
MKEDRTVSINRKVRKKYDDKERNHWACLEQIIKQSNLPFAEIMKNYPAFVRRRDLPRLLAHYELFKQIIDLPGSIVELGVYLGAGFFTWSKLLETFVPGDRSRKVYGFDNCSGYPEFSSEDGNPMPWVEGIIGEKAASESYIESMVELHNNDNLLPGVERCKIIIGDIAETVPKFASESLGTRISLLYFDVNLYEPTLIGLKWLYPLVLPGGIVAFNAYGAPPWQGEALAIERYFKEVGEQPIMRKFPFSTHPSAYFIKGDKR